MFKKDVEVINLKNHIKAKRIIWEEWQNHNILDEMNFLKEKIADCKGIIIYPEAVLWFPVQRPHHILREFAKQGYLCFFCEPCLKNDYIIKEMYENVYLVNGEEKIIPLLKDKDVTFLITYFMQYLYSENFTNKNIWFDLLDRLDFMAAYNRLSKKIYNKLLKKAKLVTYTSENLAFYLKKVKKKVLLPNGVNPTDFIKKNIVIPKDLQKVKNNGKPIIGYVGAIEKWFDFDLIDVIDKSNNYNIVIIGNIGNNVDYKKYNFKNVYFLGKKDFNLLKNYLYNFDIGIIPFIVNDLTNSVSPVKFYEYSACELPVVSTSIDEMVNINSKSLQIVDKTNILNKINDLLNEDKKVISQECQIIVENNTWKKRVEVVEGVIDYE